MVSHHHTRLRQQILTLVRKYTSYGLLISLRIISGAGIVCCTHLLILDMLSPQCTESSWELPGLVTPAIRILGRHAACTLSATVYSVPPFHLTTL